MNRHLVLSLVVPVFLAACAETGTSSRISSSRYVEALPVEDESPPKEIVRVPYAVPLPGQLKRTPEEVELPKPRPQLQGDEAVNAANETALQTPTSSDFFNAMMVYSYVDNALYQVYTAVKKITDIVFEPSEKVISYAAGDTARWQMVKTFSGEGDERREHLLVKPLSEGIGNTLVVTTNRRTYHLQLLADYETYMASVSWTYPEAALVVLENQNQSRAERARNTIEGDISLDKLNFQYSVDLVDGWSKPPWYPNMVFDDGRKVYIRFDPDVDAYSLPVLFVISNDEARLVNYRRQNNYFVVDRLFERAQLRAGGQDQTIIQIQRR